MSHERKHELRTPCISFMSVADCQRDLLSKFVRDTDKLFQSDRETCYSDFLVGTNGLRVARTRGSSLWYFSGYYAGISPKWLEPRTSGNFRDKLVRLSTIKKQCGLIPVIFLTLGTDRGSHSSSAHEECKTIRGVCCEGKLALNFCEILYDGFKDDLYFLIKVCRDAISFFMSRKFLILNIFINISHELKRKFL